MQDGNKHFPTGCNVENSFLLMWSETQHQRWFPVASGSNWNYVRAVGQCKSARQQGYFMPNLSLERKTPTLCWHWDLCVTNNLSPAKRVKTAEPNTAKSQGQHCIWKCACLDVVRQKSLWTDKLYFLSCSSAQQQTVEDDNTGLYGGWDARACSSLDVGSLLPKPNRILLRIQYSIIILLSTYWPWSNLC